MKLTCYKSLLFCALFAGQLSAQTLVDTLPEIVVSANPDSSPGSITNPSAEVAAQSLARVPGGTNLVLAADYEQGRALNLQDVFQFEPGILAFSRFGSEETRLSIRGSGLQRTFHGRGINLLLDGLTLNAADGGFDFQAFEPLVIDYVEVWRGSNAIEYGALTLGGAINFVSLTGHTAPGVTGRFEMGSFGTYKAQAAYGGVSGKWDYYASYTFSQTEGFREWARQENHRFFSNAGYTWAEGAETRLFIAYANSDSQLPGSLTKAQLEADPSQAAAGNRLREDKRDFDWFRLANVTVVENADTTSRVGVSWVYKDLDHPIFNLLTPTFSTGPGTIDLLTNDFAADLQVEHRMEWNDRATTIRAGLQPSGGVGEDNRYANLDGTSQRGPKFGDATQTAINVAGFAEIEHFIQPSVALSLAGQVAYAVRNVRDDFLVDGDSSLDQNYWGFNPKGGVRWLVDDKNTLFANVGRTFEPPSFGEIGLVRSVGGAPTFPFLLPIIDTQPIDAQTATTIEFGGQGTVGPVDWSFAFYQSWLNNELLSLNDAFGAPLGTVNANETTHTGIELGGTVTLWKDLLPSGSEDTDRIYIRGAYTWNHFRFHNDPVFGDNQLAGIPQNVMEVECVYEHPSGFYFGPNVTWVPGQTPIDHANSFYAEGYALMGLRAGYHSPRGFQIYFEARNLTNALYAASTGVIADARGVDSAQFLPGDERSFYGGFAIQW